MTISKAATKLKLEYRSSPVGPVENIQEVEDEAILDLATKRQLGLGVTDVGAIASHCMP